MEAPFNNNVNCSYGNIRRLIRDISSWFLFKCLQSNSFNYFNRSLKDEVILTLKDGEKIVADFAGKVGKREIAQGVLGSESLIITLDDLKKIIIDIKVPENYVSVLKSGLKAEEGVVNERLRSLCL